MIFNIFKANTHTSWHCVRKIKGNFSICLPYGIGVVLLHHKSKHKKRLCVCVYEREKTEKIHTSCHVTLNTHTHLEKIVSHHK